MAKRRKPGIRPARPKGFQPGPKPGIGNSGGMVLELMNFKVTWEPLPEPAVEALPGATRDRMDAIYQVLYQNPTAVIKELRELTDRHPDILCLKNWLITALRGSQDPATRAEGRALAERLFQERPDYFFARTGLADIWLNAGEFDQAAGLLLGPGKSLNLLYPGRKEFHISEIRHWAYLCCRTLIAEGKLDSARSYRNLLADMEPDSRALESMDELLNGDAGRLSQVLDALRKLADFQPRKRPRSSAETSKRKTPPNAGQLDLF